MLLLTGATGMIGSEVLQRLTTAGTPVRCLVRDPKRLGADRVRVQIALGDLADPPSFRNALRGVKTVVHMAASPRDQPHGSIEELNGIATWRMVQAAERAGVRHFVFFSALAASAHNRTRFLRAKALAEEAVTSSALRYTVFAPSLVYAPGDPFQTILSRMALLPAVPVVGAGHARFQPIWARDVADCVMAALQPGGSNGDTPQSARYELAGPETLTHDDVVRIKLRGAGRPRPLVHIPVPIASRALRALEALMKSRAPATWDMSEILEVSMTSKSGTRDAEALGVSPQRMSAVLGA